jgi:hypothetical protein
MRFCKWLFILFYAITFFNYPNPFNPRGGEVTTFECTSDVSTEAALYLYDLSARLLWKKDLTLPAGKAVQTGWNGYSNFNERAGTGIYLYHLIDRTSNKVMSKGKVWIINR